LVISNSYSFHFIQGNLILSAIIQLGCAGRLVSRNLLSMFEGSAVLQISCDAGGPKCVATGGVGQGGAGRAPFDHRQDVLPRHRIVSKLVAFPDGPEERCLLITRDLCGFYPGVQVLGEIMVAGYLVALAAFLMQPQPWAALLKVVLGREV
jgi:hypothetical protein